MGMAHSGVVVEPAVRTEESSGPTTPIRVGIIGLDAHAVPWTQIVGDPNASFVLLLSIDGGRIWSRPCRSFKAERRCSSTNRSPPPWWRRSGSSTWRDSTRCHVSQTPRFATIPGIAAARNDPKFGGVLGCEAYSSNVSILPGHPDLFYYGIHGCEILFTIMGPGCKTVTRVSSETADLVAGVWQTAGWERSEGSSRRNRGLAPRCSAGRRSSGG